MGHTIESLLDTCRGFMQFEDIYEQMPHDCEAYKEYVIWLEVFDELMDLMQQKEVLPA